MKCSCSGGQCCVIAGEECDDAMGCCGGLVCGPNRRCTTATGVGGGGATGGGATGGGGGGAVGPLILNVLDGGTLLSAGLVLVYPDGGIVGTDRYCGDGGERPTWIHSDGGVTTSTCCQPNYGSGACVAGLQTCALPGHRSSPAMPCCYCDQGCPEDLYSMMCPVDNLSPIDLLVSPVNVNQLPPDAFCGAGGLKVLEGCCIPDPTYTICSFPPLGSGSCSLDSTSSICCFTAWAVASDPILLNDCRVNGACECNLTTGRCLPTAGAQCVDIRP